MALPGNATRSSADEEETKERIEESSTRLERAMAHAKEFIEATPEQHKK
jgi:hypothetical protein